VSDKFLHLGCGDKLLPPPWVNADAQPGTGIDLVVNLYDPWQLESDTYSWLYGSHVIEHIAPDRLPAALTHLHRILVPGGRLTLATTSLEGIFDAYLAGYTPAQWNAYLFGDMRSTDSPFMAHRQTFTEPYLTELLRAAGFATVRPWSLEQYPDIFALNDCARSSHHVTLALEGVK
jgi:predicted SAM-dependent methyltransferase